MAIINGTQWVDIIDLAAAPPYQATRFDDIINGNGGDDVIDGAGGNDTINGGDGKDIINGGDGNDIINGGAGDDNLVGGNGMDTIYGGLGDDTITSDGDGGRYYGEAGNDVMKSGIGNEFMDGGVGTDTIDHRAFSGNYDYNMATGVTNFTAPVGERFFNFENAYMGDGADVVSGTSGANSINGGGGNDRLTGGLGIDTLTGGSGSDQFRIGESGAATRDLITDFSVVDDSIVLLDALDTGLPGALAAGIAGLSFNGGAVVGNSLNAACFFKGCGLSGTAAGSQSGIYVDSCSGDIWYNPTTAAAGDSRLLARVSVAAVGAMTSADFLYG